MSDYTPKLIEVALPLAAINEQCAREKTIRHGNPSTLHLWWARRPLAAARAVIWASLVDDPSGDPELSREDQDRERNRLFGILERLVDWENTNNPRVLAEARREIDRCYPEGAPPVLDPFGGGGAIPLEAQRLGLEARSGDLNPVAVLIQKAMLEIPPRFASHPPVNPDAAGQLSWSGVDGLVSDIEHYGEVMARHAERTLSASFPDVLTPEGGNATPIVWFWVRTIQSPDPTWKGHVPLTGSWILRKKKNSPVLWVEPRVDHANRSISYEIREGGNPADGTISRGKGRCLATGAAITNAYIRKEGVAGRIGHSLIAIVAENPAGRGRVYCAPRPEDEATALEHVAGDGWSPEGRMSTHPQYMGTPRYGFATWASLFLPRQLHTLSSLVDLLPEIRSKVVADARNAGMPHDVRLHEGGAGAEAYGDAVITYLAFLVDRCSARWNHLSVWDAGRESLAHIFRLNAFQMTWMHAEVNPFSSSTGNLRGQIEWITKALLHLPSEGRANVVQQDATSRVRDCRDVMICTDPPYYDNIPYSDLADFFYVWLRKMLPDVWPGLFTTLLTPKAEELVADNQRHGSRGGAAEFFESGMSKFMEQVRASQSSQAPATIFYAYKAAEIVDGEVVSTGWDTFLQALIDAGMTITATWPVRTEMPGGTRMAKRNVLSSSVVLSCRPRPQAAPMATRAEFIERLRQALPAALRTLQSGNVPPIDLPQSAIGPGMGVFSSLSRVVEADGSAMPVRRALVIINEMLDEIIAGEESDMDPDSRFAMTWYRQYGYQAGAFGDADNLARAKNTSVQGVVDAGIASLGGGKLRLLRRDELPEAWDPREDARLTVWETLQHLVDALHRSESDAARLLQTLEGSGADGARAMAYVLFQTATEKGWADEAAAFNGLITAWPSLQSIASSEATGATQSSLI